MLSKTLLTNECWLVGILGQRPDTVLSDVEHCAGDGALRRLDTAIVAG